jgi:hypothetical protein
MLNDHQIEDLSKRMNIPLEGVFFKDELPKKLTVNKVYIINLQDSITDDGDENSGTHWTMGYIRETPKGQLQPIYFDPYGVPPPENVKNIIEKQTNLKCPYTTKDIQSLMNNACGFYCLALAHYICASKYRKNNLYEDVDTFMDMFDDLNHSIDWKKNEYLLKHFFLSEDPSKRIDVDVISQTHDDYDRIINEDTKGGVDMMKLPVGVNYINKK